MKATVSDRQSSLLPVTGFGTCAFASARNNAPLMGSGPCGLRSPRLAVQPCTQYGCLLFLVSAPASAGCLVTADRFCDCGGSYVAFVVLHTVLGHFGCTICSMGVSDIFCDNTIFTFIQFNADTLRLVRRYMLRKMPDLPTLSSSYQ